MRLGLLGGTFDPVHHGHLRFAEEAADAFELDRVLLVLSAAPPHKGIEGMTPAPIRWRMLQLACEGNPRLIPSPLEMERTGPSFTVDTLIQIRKELSVEDEIFLLIGADSAEELPTWKSHRRILEIARVVVAPRSSSPALTLAPDVRERVRFLEAPKLEISSTRIREFVRAGKSVRYLVPDSVFEVIREKSLYSGDNPRGRARAECSRREATA